MTTRKITIGILLIITITLIGWDLYVFSTPITGDTISEIILGAAHKYPVLPFAFGVLMGHLFWPQRDKE